MHSSRAARRRGQCPKAASRRGPQRGSRVGVAMRGRSGAESIDGDRAQRHAGRRDGRGARSPSARSSDQARECEQRHDLERDQIGAQNVVVIWALIEVSGQRALAAPSSSKSHQTQAGKPRRERPPRTGVGPPFARGGGVFTPRLAHQSRHRRSKTGGTRRRPIVVVRR